MLSERGTHGKGSGFSLIFSEIRSDHLASSTEFSARLGVKRNDSKRAGGLGNHHWATRTFDHDLRFNEDQIPAGAQYFSATSELGTQRWTQE